MEKITGKTAGKKNDFFRNRNGDPVFLTGLQCHNSSVGTPMMNQTIEAIRLYGGNLLEAPVCWCDVEPEEGVYDMSPVQELLDQAAGADLYLIPLWFGASKNGMYTYAPEYVKNNPAVYRRARDGRGYPVASFSACCEAVLERDRAAFVRVMEYLAEHDTKGSVIAVQVENEVGLAHTDRDYSPESEEEYCRPVPEYLRNIRLEDAYEPVNEPMREPVHEVACEPAEEEAAACNPAREDVPARDSAFTWKSCFGRHSAEAFTAWQHACYIQKLVEAGQEKLDVPYIMNISVEVNEYEEPGHCYISGGPVARVLEIWKRTAPGITLFGPDIYLPAERDYREVCERYAQEDNPLFIPESSIHGTGAGLNMLTAVADYHAIGVCCFGAESAVQDGKLIPEAEETAVSMRAISSLAPLLIRYRNTGRVYAVTQSEFSSWQHVLTEKYHVLARFLNQEKNRRGYFGSRINLYAEENQEHLMRRGRCLIIDAGDGEFFAAGCGVCLEFIRRPEAAEERAYEQIRTDVSSQMRFLSIEEGHFEDGGKWVCEYRRNGDEAYGPVYIHEGSAVRVRLEKPEKIW